MMLVLLSASLAFETSGAVWSTGNLPVVLDWAGLPSGMSHEETVSALDAAALAWSEAACTSFSVTFQEGEDSELVSGDGVSALRFVDIDEGDPPAWVSRRADYDLPPETRNGSEYQVVVEADVHMSVGATWMTDAAIDAGACSDAWSFQASVIQAIGFVAGLDENCSGNYCDAREELGSMGIEPEPCSTEISSLGEDDALGITELYGTAIRATCAWDSGLRTIACSAESPQGGDVTWDFGDGSTGVGLTIEHTYATYENYVVSACSPVEGCDVPTCLPIDVQFLPPGTTDGVVLAEAGEGCGCRTSPGGLPMILGGIALVGCASRRRRLKSV